MGQNGEETMLRLLLDCGIFSCMDNEKGAFYQLSGKSVAAIEGLLAYNIIRNPSVRAGTGSKTDRRTAS